MNPNDPPETRRIESRQRKGSVLTRPKLPCLGSFHTINLTAGCPNQCRYCYAQSYAQHPGWEKIAFYVNAKEKLKQELKRMREAPRLVYFSTASDPFVPAAPIQNDLYDMMSMLLDCGTALIISSKCVIQPRFVELFARYPEKVHVQVGITTVDDAARRVIEPGAASVGDRLRNLEILAGYRIGREARLDPLVPGLTDTIQSVEELFEALGRIRVQTVVTSFLFLRHGIDFPDQLAYRDWSSSAMKRLYTQKVDDYCGGGSIWLPSLGYRSERLACLNALASRHGMRMLICRCKNSDDVQSSCCHPAELAWRATDDDRQLTLF
ncbi:MAG: radical SAM protein [Candidatus Sumerlaeia bacterium]